MGLPMMPSPIKPTFSAIASSPSLEFQVFDGDVPRAQCSGKPREALLGGSGRRVVFQADVALVAELFEPGEDVRVADLAGPRLPSFGRVGDLDVPDHAYVPFERRDEVPLHTLHVVEIVLYLYVLAPDAPHETGGLLRGAQQVRPVLEGVDGLHQHLDPDLSGLVRREGHVPARQRELILA